jgi:hypothetical protein
MSWYNRKPRIKEPPKQLPHHHSPMAEKALKEAKQKYSTDKPKKTK